MTDEQIQALIAFVHAAMNAAVAEANGKDEWRHDRLAARERELIAALAPASPHKESQNG